MGDFCHGDPTLDKTDTECFGQPDPFRDSSRIDCATGAMIDVKVTQTEPAAVLPAARLHPNISAHARVAAQGIGSSNNLKPLGVRDPGVIPCIKVNLVPFGGTGTRRRPRPFSSRVNNNLTTSTGPTIWDNWSHNGGYG